MPEQFQNTVLHINRSHSTQAKYKTLPGLINELRADHELQRFRAAAGQAPRTNDVAFQATVENTCFYCTKPGHVARQCRSKTGDMERVIYRKNINEHGRQQQNPPPNGYPRGGRNHNQRGGRAGRGGRGRGNNRHDHANNAAEDIFFLNEENSDEEIGCEVKIDMLNLNEDTNHDGEEQMVIFDSGRIDVDKMGKFRIKNPNGTTCVFTNVLYVPTLRHTLVSVPALTSKERVTVQFKGKTCSIKVGDRVSAEAKLNDRRMYQLTGKIEAAPDDIACFATDGATWHQRLGHPYHQGVFTTFFTLT
ncbi:hypothetical protein DYB35_008541 [Aphanomyces astaci]|uniref:CCHC-type domain-containing protein n=1 Tax=Aphanomyces astaci TaxID=112090 RepID=A0A3R7A0Y3_APHAT|nr:hypothetical protein DYB35_008541 [Aphanomyces astaci]